MKEIIAHMTLENVKILQECRGFIPRWAYLHHDSQLTEWGTLCLGNIQIIILADIETQTKTTYKIRQ